MKLSNKFVFSIQSLQLLVSCMDCQEFAATVDFVPVCFLS